MSNEKFTKLIRQIHDEKVHLDFANQAIEETEQKLSVSLEHRLQKLIQESNKIAENVIEFPERKVVSIGEATLMAAAGQKLSNWYENPLIFSSTGFIVDVRPILGTENEVEITLQAKDKEHLSQISNLLEPYKSQSLDVSISIKGNTVLKANIYIDDTAEYAEGSGEITSGYKDSLHGIIEFNIILD